MQAASNHLREQQQNWAVFTRGKQSFPPRAEPLRSRFDLLKASRTKDVNRQCTSGRNVNTQATYEAKRNLAACTVEHTSSERTSEISVEADARVSEHIDDEPRNVIRQGEGPTATTFLHQLGEPVRLRTMQCRRRSPSARSQAHQILTCSHDC